MFIFLTTIYLKDVIDYQKVDLTENKKIKENKVSIH